MAAILCNGLNEICKLLCLPCRACGLGCRSLGDVLASPFFPYLAVTYSLNIPSLIYGFRGLITAGTHNSSCSPGTQWLMINILLSASHLVASWYLVYKIRQDRVMNEWVHGGSITGMSPNQSYDYGSGGNSSVASPVTAAASVQQPLHAVTTGTDDAIAVANSKKMEQGSYQPPPSTNPEIFVKAVPIANQQQQQQPVRPNTNAKKGPAGTRNSLTRIKHVLCYDPVVAIYIVVFLVWIVWQSVGTSRAFKLAASNYCSLVQDWIMISIICGYLYMGLVGIAFMCSLCCLR